MKPYNSLKLILTLNFCAAILFCNGQTKEKCGPYKIDKAAFAKALDYEKYHHNLAPASPIMLRVFFQICRPDGGGGTSVTENMMQTEIDRLTHAYGPNNICFLNGGYDYINNTALDTFNFSSNSPDLFDPYKVPNCITVFFIDRLGGKNGSSGGGASGVTFGVPNAWTIVEKNYINAGTTEHETGHCLGLLHTFDFNHGNGLENIDESNGESSADLIADTYADPYVFKFEDKKPCYSAANCMYTGTCTDPKGNPNYNPPYTNLMSYWCQAWFPTYTVTTGQYTRVSSFLNTASVLQDCESQAAVIENANNYSSGYHINSATNTLTTSGSVAFTNTVKATLGAGATVFLEPGFTASPSSGGRVFIRNIICSSGSPIAQELLYASKKDPGNNLKKSLPAALSVYPNPASSIINIAFTVPNNQARATIKIYSANGQLLQEITLGHTPKGSYLKSTDISKLSGGLYAIVLQLDESIIKTTVVLAK